MGGLHCVPVAAFNRKPKQIYIQVFGSVLEPQKKKSTSKTNGREEEELLELHAICYILEEPWPQRQYGFPGPPKMHPCLSWP